MGFQRAQRRKAKLRLAISGSSGSGKTYSSLLIAKGIGGKIAMIDTENGSGELYANLCDYDVMQIGAPFTVDKYINAISEAEAAGYDVLIIDSLSHAWNGPGGLLEQQSDLAATRYKGNSWSAWRDITPQQNKLVQAILQSNVHIIATMRSKVEYIQTDDRKIKKVGTAPVQRDGLEYEFTLMLDIDQETHKAAASKDRTSLFDGKTIVPNEAMGKELLDWLENGIDEPAMKPQLPATKPQLQAIVAKMKELSISSEEIKQIMQRKYSVASSASLNSVQAQELLEHLADFAAEVAQVTDNKADEAVLEAALDAAENKGDA